MKNNTLKSFLIRTKKKLSRVKNKTQKVRVVDVELVARKLTALLLVIFKTITYNYDKANAQAQVLFRLWFLNKNILSICK